MCLAIARDLERGIMIARKFWCIAFVIGYKFILEYLAIILVILLYNSEIGAPASCLDTTFSQRMFEPMYALASMSNIKRQNPENKCPFVIKWHGTV